MDSNEDAFGRLLIQRLVANIQCAVCGKPYVVDNVQILGHQDDLWISAVTCAHCRTQGLVFAVVREGDLESEVFSELTPDEFDALNGLEEISVDDVLDVHDFLRGFHGDFFQLLEGKTGD